MTDDLHLPDEQAQRDAHGQGQEISGKGLLDAHQRMLLQERAVGVGPAVEDEVELREPIAQVSGKGNRLVKRSPARLNATVCPSGLSNSKRKPFEFGFPRVKATLPADTFVTRAVTSRSAQEAAAEARSTPSIITVCISTIILSLSFSVKDSFVLVCPIFVFAPKTFCAILHIFGHRLLIHQILLPNPL